MNQSHRSDRRISEIRRRIRRYDGVSLSESPPKSVLNAFKLPHFIGFSRKLQQLRIEMKRSFLLTLNYNMACVAIVYAVLFFLYSTFFPHESEGEIH